MPYKLMMFSFALSTSLAALAAPSYTASLATPAAARQIVSSDRLWSCDGASCHAAGEASSPAKNICSRIAREVGALTGFTARGHVFTADELAACNARAGHVSALPAAAN